MTYQQKQQAEALMTVPIAEEREQKFVANMRYISRHDSFKWLSPKQADWLEALAWKYRAELIAAGFEQLVPIEEPKAKQS